MIVIANTFKFFDFSSNPLMIVVNVLKNDTINIVLIKISIMNTVSLKINIENSSHCNTNVKNVCGMRSCS